MHDNTADWKTPETLDRLSRCLTFPSYKYPGRLSYSSDFFFQYDFPTNSTVGHWRESQINFSSKLFVNFSKCSRVGRGPGPMFSARHQKNRRAARYAANQENAFTCFYGPLRPFWLSQTVQNLEFSSTKYYGVPFFRCGFFTLWALSGAGTRTKALRLWTDTSLLSQKVRWLSP